MINTVSLDSFFNYKKDEQITYLNEKASFLFVSKVLYKMKRILKEIKGLSIEQIENDIEQNIFPPYARYIYDLIHVANERFQSYLEKKECYNDYIKEMKAVSSREKEVDFRAIFDPKNQDFLKLILAGSQEAASQGQPIFRFICSSIPDHYDDFLPTWELLEDSHKNVLTLFFNPTRDLARDLNILRLIIEDWKKDPSDDNLQKMRKAIHSFTEKSLQDAVCILEAIARFGDDELFLIYLNCIFDRLLYLHINTKTMTITGLRDKYISEDDIFTPFFSLQVGQQIEAILDKYLNAIYENEAVPTEIKTILTEYGDSLENKGALSQWDYLIDMYEDEFIYEDAKEEIKAKLAKAPDEGPLSKIGKMIHILNYFYSSKAPFAKSLNEVISKLRENFENIEFKITLTNNLPELVKEYLDDLLSPRSILIISSIGNYCDAVKKVVGNSSTKLYNKIFNTSILNAQEKAMISREKLPTLKHLAFTAVEKYDLSLDTIPEDIKPKFLFMAKLLGFGK